MKVVIRGDKLLSKDQINHLTRGKLPEWLSTFVLGLLDVESNVVIIRLQVEDGKIRPNGPISRLKRYANGYQYHGPFMDWDEILQCPSAQAALALVQSRIAKAR